MRMKKWLKYLSVLMSMVLLMAMMPAGASMAAEGKILLISFEKLELPDTDNFPQGTEEKDLCLPKKIMAEDSEGNQIELSELEWTIRPQLGEEKFDEDTTVEPVKYDPLKTEPGKYVFTLKLSDEYEVEDEKELPKVVLTIEPVEVPVEETTEAPVEETNEAPTEAPVEETNEAPTEAPVEETNEAPVEIPVEETNEASVEVPVEETNEAPTDIPVEETNEAPTEAPVEETNEAPTDTFTEAPADVVEPSNDMLTNNGLEGPTVSLVLPEKMEVGGTYQLQYAVSDTGAAEVVEDSVNYSVEDGEENVDMPDEDGTFEVLSEGTVAFQVGLMLTNGVELQAYAQSNTVSPAGEEAPPADNELVVPSSSAEMISFKVGDVEVRPDDPEDVDVILTLPCGSEQDLKNINPVIEISEGATVVTEPASEGGLDFSDGLEKTFIVTAEDGVTTKSYQVSVVKALHSYGEWVTTKEAACTENGEQTRTCGDCGKTETQEIPAKGHTPAEQWNITKEATCTEEGTQVQYCTVCGEVANSQALPALGHIWNTVHTDPTCAEDGKEYKECERCGEISDETVLPALGHIWSTVHTDPTCTEDGEEYKKCERCGEISDRTVIKALGHSWETFRTEPTCTEDGEEYKKCERCGKISGKKVLKALGHSWSEWTVTLQPTTSSKGKQERKCQRKGCNVTESKEIQRLNIIGQASNNTIWGIDSSAKYPVNSVITFEAIGDCMDNAEPISGDVRYVPVSTWHLVNDYKWGSNGYSASFRITKAGNYTLEVTFQKQTYDGSQWVNNEGEASIVSRNFVVAGEGQFTDENGNGTGNTNNPDVVIGGGVKTGDNTPIITLVVILVAAAAILMILGIVRKKSKK